MTDPVTDLLVQVTRCPIAHRCLAGERLPCSTITNSQHAHPDSFHVPEPWSGHITQAQVLFVSSNPSIDPAEAYPTASWSDDQRVRFFEHRFDDKPLPWIDDRMRPLMRTSPPRHREGRGNPFWSSARNRATELLGRDAVQGRDFVLTEVVHCKSVGELGVEEALDTCVDSWLRPLVAAAAAPVIVLFGRHAKTAFYHVFGIPHGRPMSGPHELEGRARIVLQLPHPNERGSLKQNCAPLTQSQLDQVRGFLMGRLQ